MCTLQDIYHRRRYSKQNKWGSQAAAQHGRSCGQINERAGARWGSRAGWEEERDTGSTTEIHGRDSK